MAHTATNSVTVCREKNILQCCCANFSSICVYCGFI